MQALYETDITADELRAEVELTRAALVEEFQGDARDAYEERTQEWGPEITGEVERFFVLQVVDTRWREHLENMDYLREGVHLRSMAQKDPLVEYTAEGHVMFEELGASIREEVVLLLFHAEVYAKRGRGRRAGRASEPERAGQREPRLRARVARRRGRDRRSRWGRPVAASAGRRPPRPSWRPSTRSWAATIRAGAGRARSSSAVTALKSQPALCRRSGMRALLGVSLLALCLPLAAGARTSLYEDRELPLGLGVTNASRIEPFFGRVAASLAGKSGQLRCWSSLRLGAHQRGVHQHGASEENLDYVSGFYRPTTNRIHLGPTACSGLVQLHYEHGTRRAGGQRETSPSRS